VTRHGASPKANIPIVLFPAAEPEFDAAVAAPPAATVQPEYVYLSRVVTPDGKLAVEPNAKIPIALVPAAEPYREAVVAAPPAATVQPE
jgi:hypothetical protein